MNVQRKRKPPRKKAKIILTVLKFGLLLGILIGLPLYIYFFHYEWIEQMSSLENVKSFFQDYRAVSVFVYLAAQVTQIVICIIPGQALQFAAGYMYGFWLGYLFSLIGAAIGTVLTYYLAKLLGHDAMHLIFGEEKMQENIARLNSKRAIVIVFLIFLIPGVPKDLCNYAAGISEMKLKAFLIVSLIGRSPGMMGSLLIGRQIGSGYYTSAIVIAVIAVALCILGVLMRKKLTKYLDRFYDKLYH